MNANIGMESMLPILSPFSSSFEHWFCDHFSNKTLKCDFAAKAKFAIQKGVLAVKALNKSMD